MIMNRIASWPKHCNTSVSLRHSVCVVQKICSRLLQGTLNYHVSTETEAVNTLGSKAESHYSIVLKCIAL